MDLRELTGAERRHPWEVARARFFAALVRRHVPAVSPVRVLDIGAGDGYLAGELIARLPAGSSCLCVDAHYTDTHLRELPRRAAAGVRFAREAPEHAFDVLLMLDVLEHVEDDAALLERCAARLAPGGQLVASVPAFMALYSRHDLFLGHHRRYRLAELRALLSAGGFEVTASGGLFHTLLPVRALQKAAELMTGQAARPGALGFAAAQGRGSDLGAFRGGPLATRLVSGALATDTALTRAAGRLGIALPGLSVWAWGIRSGDR